VLGELLSGLGAVVEAVALKVDEKIRPAISGLTNDLFGLAGAILDGDWEQFKQILQGWYDSIVGFDFAGAVNTVISKIGDAVSGFFDFLAETDIRGALRSLYSRIIDGVERIEWGNTFRDIISSLGDFLKNTDWIGIASDLVNFLARANKAVFKEVNWSKWYSFIKDGLINWIKDVDWSSVAVRIARNIASGLRSLGGFIIDTAISAATGGGGGVSDAGAGGGFRANRGGGLSINMDGRDVTESTGRFRLDETTRRGL